MKQILLLALAIFALVSCGSDGCVTCEKQLPNSTTSAEICEDGTGITVRNTVIGVIKDEAIPNTTVEAYQATLQTAGYTCK